MKKMTTYANGRMKIPLVILTSLVFSTMGFIALSGEGNPNDLLIIANNSVKANSISPGEARALFLKQRSNFSKGGRATPVNGKRNSAERKAFQKKVLGMTDAEEQKYWQDQKIKSGTKAPMELSNTVKAVFSIKGGISYCLRKNHKAGTSKVLLTL